MSSSPNQRHFIVSLFFFEKLNLPTSSSSLDRESLFCLFKGPEKIIEIVSFTKHFLSDLVGRGHVNFCGKAIILHSFNSNFVNAVTNIMTRGDIPTLQRPPFDLSCIFSENYEIKAFPDICKVCLYLPQRYVHSHLSRLY